MEIISSLQLLAQQNTSNNANTTPIKGVSCVGIGFEALFSNNFTSVGNTAVGQQALRSNTEGWYNTAVGYQALFSNIWSQNCAFGTQSLYSNSTGGSNSAFGHQSLSVNTSGGNNSAFGAGAMNSNLAGDTIMLLAFNHYSQIQVEKLIIHLVPVQWVQI